MPRGTLALALCFPERLSEATLLPPFICRHEVTCPDSAGPTPWEPQHPPHNPGALLGAPALASGEPPRTMELPSPTVPGGCGVRTVPTEPPDLSGFPSPLGAEQSPALEKGGFSLENHLLFMCLPPAACPETICVRPRVGHQPGSGCAAAGSRGAVRAVETRRVKRVSCPGTLGGFDHRS